MAADVKSLTAWDKAKAEILNDPSLSPNEKRALELCTVEAVVQDIEDLDRKDAGHSIRRKVMDKINPLLGMLQKFGPALDVISQVDPQGVLPVVWGSLRLVLAVRF